MTWFYEYFFLPGRDIVGSKCVGNYSPFAAAVLMLGRRKNFLMWMILHQELIGWCLIANST